MPGSAAAHPPGAIRRNGFEPAASASLRFGASLRMRGLFARMNGMTVPTPPESDHAASELQQHHAPDKRPRVAEYHPYRRPTMLANWFWFILKNVVGWILILTAMALGPLVPGPGGLPQKDEDRQHG